MADYLLAQSSVLGSMLISPQIVGDVMTNLQPEDFTEPMGQEVFLAIRALHLAGEKIDPVCVLNQMGGPDPGRRKYLLALMRETPTAQNYREYMDIVREQSRLREIQRAGLALAGTDITLETAREPVSRLYELMMDRRGMECVDMEQGMLDFYAELERTPRYLPWGLDFLDEGLTAEGGDFVVLGGYPSDGKTALALSMAYAQAETLRVGFFSLETKTSKLFSRICSMVAQVSSQRIKRRELTEEDYFQLERKVDEVKKRRLSLIRASSMTVEDIRAYTLAHRFDVIYVDYLTLIRAPGKTEFDQATYISKALHQMAQDLNITVVALSQLSRPEGGKPKPPTLASCAPPDRSSRTRTWSCSSSGRSRGCYGAGVSSGWPKTRRARQDRSRWCFVARPRPSGQTPWGSCSRGPRRSRSTSRWSLERWRTQGRIPPKSSQKIDTKELSP